MQTKKKILPSAKGFGALDYVISIALFALIFTVLFFILVALFGVAFIKLPQPLKMTNIATLGSLYVSALASSFIISKKNGQKYLLLATFNSLFLSFLLLILSFFGDGPLCLDFILRILCVLFCYIGAFLGIKREKIKKHKHRR